MDPWITYALSALGLLMGGGGLVAWYKARNEAKAQERAARRAEEVALSDRWRSLIDVQTRSLLDPLNHRVEALNTEVVTLRKEVADLRAAKYEVERREELLWDWADELVDHIRKHLPPPEPNKPVGLQKP